jgi:hypothetical protein
MSKKEQASLGACPECGANMDLVGRAHNCRPLPKLDRQQPAPAEDRAGWAKGNPKSVAALKKAGNLPGDGLPSKSQIRRIEAGLAIKAAKKKAVVKSLTEKVSARPPAHPDCERCKWDAKQTYQRVKRFRQRGKAG